MGFFLLKKYVFYFLGPKSHYVLGVAANVPLFISTQCHGTVLPPGRQAEGRTNNSTQVNHVVFPRPTHVVHTGLFSTTLKISIEGFADHSFYYRQYAHN